MRLNSDSGGRSSWVRGAQQSGRCFVLWGAADSPRQNQAFVFLGHTTFSHYEEVLLRRTITVTTPEISPNSCGCAVKRPCVQQLWWLPSFPPRISRFTGRSLWLFCSSRPHRASPAVPLLHQYVLPAAPRHLPDHSQQPPGEEHHHLRLPL